MPPVARHINAVCIWAMAIKCCDMNQACKIWTNYCSRSCQHQSMGAAFAKIQTNNNTVEIVLALEPPYQADPYLPIRKGVTPEI